MKVTAQEEYGLRCMIQMAVSSLEHPLTIHEVAGREGLSIPYVSKLMARLREAGLVDSVRGRAGGYFITRPPEKVSVSEIMASLGDRLFEQQYCERYPGDEAECVHMGGCSIRSLWGTLEGLVEQVLRRTTLADLMKSERIVSEGLLMRQRRLLPIVNQAPDAMPPASSLDKGSRES